MLLLNRLWKTLLKIGVHFVAALHVYIIALLCMCPILMLVLAVSDSTYPALFVYIMEHNKRCLFLSPIPLFIVLFIWLEKKLHEK